DAGALGTAPGAPRKGGSRRKPGQHSSPPSAVTKLVSFLNPEPPSLLVTEIKFRHGGGFGRLLIRRLDSPEVLPSLSDDRDAPASQFGGEGLLSHAGCFATQLGGTRQKQGGMTAWLQARFMPENLDQVASDGTSRDSQR